MTLGGSFSQQFAGSLYADEINIHVDAADEDEGDDVAEMSFAQLKSGRDIELRVRERALWRSQLPGCAAAAGGFGIWALLSKAILAAPVLQPFAVLLILAAAIASLLAAWLLLPEACRNLRRRQRAVKREAETTLVQYDTELARRACARRRFND